MTRVIIGMRNRIGVGARGGHGRRSLLEDSILTWTRVIREVASRLSATHLTQQMTALQQDPHAAQQWLSDAHLLVIGCRQVDRHLMFLQKLGFRTRRKERAAKQFFGAYNSTDLKDLRDLLEHQADYLAGEGRNPKLAIDLTLPLVFLAEADPQRIMRHPKGVGRGIVMRILALAVTVMLCLASLRPAPKTLKLGGGLRKR